MYLKFHLNDLEGVRVMEPINMQCKSISQITSMFYVESSVSGRAYIRRRSVDINLVEIHAEMSELLEKQVYVLNECFKYIFRDSRRGSRKPTKSV